MRQQKIRFTVWLEAPVYEAAKIRAERGGLSLSVVLAEAAKESLLEAYRSDREAELLKAVERVFYKVKRIEDRHGLDHRVLQEMLGLAVLSFFNHTPAVPEDQKKASLLSGRIRFERYLDLLAKNVRGGGSVLGATAAAAATPPETEPPSDSQPQPNKPLPKPNSPVHLAETPSGKETAPNRGLFDAINGDDQSHNH